MKKLTVRKVAPVKKASVNFGLKTTPQWMASTQKKAHGSDLVPLPEGISYILEEHQAVVRGLYLVFRARKVIRGKKTWLGFHPDFEKAVNFVEKARTRGVSWEIHPWPALRLRVKATEILLIPTMKVFPDSLVRKIQKGSPFDFAIMGTEFIKASSHDFLFQSGLQPLSESDLDHYCRSSAFSWGEWYESMYDPLDWPVMSASEGRQIHEHLTRHVSVESPKDHLIGELKRRLSREGLDFSVINSRTGRVLAASGSVVGRSEIEAIIESRSSLQIVPEGAGEELRLLIKLFSPYL